MLLNIEKKKKNGEQSRSAEENFHGKMPIYTFKNRLILFYEPLIKFCKNQRIGKDHIGSHLYKNMGPRDTKKKTT